MRGNKYFAVLATVAVTACGGGDGDDNDRVELLTGEFIDSAVIGISYSTESQSGTTNSAGEFQYVSGESVVFSIGELTLPSISAAPVVTPVDMSDSGEFDDDTVVNISKLLQSLDEDADLQNGIQIPESASASASELDYSVGRSEFESNPNVINFIANSGSVSTSLRSTDDVLAHLDETLLIPITQLDLTELVGTRLFLNENFLILRNDGTFDGTWEDQPLLATWELRDGYFCRVLTEFHNADAIGAEDCQLWRKEITGNRIRGSRDRGNGVSWWYTIGS